jgi:hypothetical protein
VTHPYHPLFGRSFELLTYRKTWGEDRVFFYDAGRLRALPANWTDAAPVVPFVAIAAGRAHFRLEDLLQLAELVETQRRERDAASKASGKFCRPCKANHAATKGASTRKRLK